MRGLPEPHSRARSSSGSSSKISCFNKQFNYQDLTSLLYQKFFLKKMPSHPTVNLVDEEKNMINVVYSTPANSLPPHIQDQL